LVVDDRGFFVPALNGFPGPFVKLLLNSFGIKGLVKLMDGEEDRRAVFSSAVGYFDGQEDRIFVSDEVGTVLEKPAGDNTRGWSDLLYIYSPSTFPGKSLAELSDSQWQEYLDDCDEHDPFSSLRDYLAEHKILAPRA
jgi:XTP/dITP diphosphohydrolase